jgi:hypothetical protein
MVERGLWTRFDSYIKGIATKLKTPPISLLDVYTAQRKHVTSLKVTPLSGKYPGFGILAHHRLTISQTRGAPSRLASPAETSSPPQAMRTLR